MSQARTQVGVGWGGDGGGGGIGYGPVPEGHYINFASEPLCLFFYIYIATDFS